eukprot:scaffold437_cov168-Ochromonas_danica.AAC.48
MVPVGVVVQLALILSVLTSLATSLSQRNLRTSAQPNFEKTLNGPDPFGSNLGMRNLKTAGHNPSREDALVQRWKEFQGLSERFLVRGVDDAGRQDKAVALAYRRCEYVTQLFSKTFYVGSSLMPPESRKHVWAVYAWCRRTDDLVDSPRALLSRESLQADLEDWSRRLEGIWRGQPVDLFDLAMADTVRAYPTLSIEPFQDMIKGMVMDVPGLGQDRYANFADLYLYCYRVAGTVGLMTLPILQQRRSGVVEDYREAIEPAVALGIALQLTNILRDVGEDLERGRIYLPQDELKGFGLSEEDIASCQVTPRYVEYMKFSIARARDYYALAGKGVHLLMPSARFAVQASLDLYGRILDVIERNGYDNFNKRAFTTKFEKLSILPQSFLRANRAPSKG